MRAFIADLRDITGIGLMTLEAIEVIDPEIIADASDERE
ncbi:conserved hypothetical protein [Sphingomonas sp. EC-HK361]|nr:conserved hypothetical protein [Sphingomonas sp. EC-HK361]